MSTSQGYGGNTRNRLFEAAESLFIESGYGAMSLRQITNRADANLAAVNYHFGGKEALMQELLSARLDRLNQHRLQLLSACEERPDLITLDASAILSILFVPALRLSRDRAGGPAFMQLLGRVYSDPSPFMRNYLQAHYRPIFGRFFEAFSRALPELPRNELGMRLHLSLKALAGVLAGESLDDLIASFSMGQKIDDSAVLERLITLLSPILTTPRGESSQTPVINQMMTLAVAAPGVADAGNRKPRTPPIPRRRARPFDDLASRK